MRAIQKIVIAVGCLSAASGQVNPRGMAGGTGEFLVHPLRDVRSVAWEARPGFRDFGKMAVSDGVVVTGNATGTGGTFGFHAATEALLWGTHGKQMKGAPAVDSQAAYVVGYVDGLRFGLSSLALKTGKPNWSVEEPDLGIHDAAPLVAPGRVYLISENGKVKAYDSLTGKPVWEQAYGPGKGKCPTAMSLADGVLYFGGGEVSYGGSAGRFLWALDAATGKVLWRYQAKPEEYDSGGACVTPPAVSGGIVVTASEHVLFALDAKTGALRSSPSRRPRLR
jgi:outer membrane protein assembly factor BamB